MHTQRLCRILYFTQIKIDLVGTASWSDEIVSHKLRVFQFETSFFE